MDFEYDKSWDSLTTVLEFKMTAKDAWMKFLELHEEMVQKSYWTDLKQIDVEAEQVHIVSWVTGMVTKEPIPKNIVALWIGVFKNQNEIPTIYFGGADKYNKDDSDWRCDLNYLPKNRYAQPGLLQEIDVISKTDEENYEFLDWILPVAYCAFTFDEIVRTKLDKNLFLKHKDKLFIAIGHDSGDFVDVTPIEN
jgi:hypothetical protein